MKKYDRDNNFSYAIGVFPTLELLASRPAQVNKVIVTENSEKNSGITKINQLCSQFNIPVEVNDAAVNKLSGHENSYALAVFTKYESQLDDRDHLVLVHPSDMGNMGTIIRTMVAFNFFNLVLIRPAVDIFDPKAIRASMGAVFKINFSYFADFNQYQTGFNHSIYPFLTNGKSLLCEASFVSPMSLVFGNEGAGLPQEFEAIGHSIRIPQSSGVDSLNLSVAVGIGLYSAHVKNTRSA